MASSCPNCGYAYNPENSDRCVMCGGSLGSGQERHQDDPQEIGYNQSPGEPATPVRVLSGGNTSGSGGINPVRALPDRQEDERHSINGRIVHVERHDEQPPSDFFKKCAIVLLFILFFIPFVCIMLFMGILSISFAILGFRDLMQLVSPAVWSHAFFEFLEVLVLGNLRGSRTIPVYRGDLEGPGGRAYFFIFRGPIRSGNLVTGHDVAFRGSRQDGTFDVKSGVDLTTNALIATAYRNPWPVVFVVLALIYGAAGFWAIYYYFYF